MYNVNLRDYKYIAVCGNIGSGKTTLVENLKRGTLCDYYSLFEDPHKNNWLETFYSTGNHCLEMQLEFLTHFASQSAFIKDVLINGGRIIQDRLLHEVVDVFSNFYTNYKKNMLSAQQFNTIYNLYQTLLKLIPKPELVIFLNPTPKVCYERVIKRNRNKEVDVVDIDYLNVLNDLYKQLYNDMIKQGVNKIGETNHVSYYGYWSGTNLLLERGDFNE